MSKPPIPVYRVELVYDGGLGIAPVLADTAAKVAEMVRAYIGRTAREHLILILLDARQQVTGLHTVSMGTLTASLVHPREVYQAAILGTAAAIIIAHNHPSGDPSPSQEDCQATKRLAQAGELLGIPLVDHVIVCAGGYYSFHEHGDL